MAATSNTRIKQARQVVYTACCLIFVSFTFLYLFFFQSDMLSMVQHIMSNGRTSYHVLIFSSLITLVLSVLPFAQSYFIKLPVKFISLLWFPSFWALGWLTDVGLSEVAPTSHSINAVPFVITAILYAMAIFAGTRLSREVEANTPLTNIFWPNILLLVIAMTFTTYVSNTNRTIHYELRLERLVTEEKYQNVLDISAQEEHPSRCIMSIRAYALSRLGELGDRLFFYPNSSGGESLLPPPTDSLRPSNLPKILREYLGGFPIHDMNATRYLQHLAADSLASEHVHEYLLCALLLDKNIDTFVDSLVVYYSPKDGPVKFPVHLSSLPRHFAEATILYQRMSESPKVVLDDDETLENYLAFLEQYKKVDDPVEREAICRKYYNETYWTYYYFNK